MPLLGSENLMLESSAVTLISADFSRFLFKVKKVPAF